MMQGYGYPYQQQAYPGFAPQMMGQQPGFGLPMNNVLNDDEIKTIKTQNTMQFFVQPTQTEALRNVCTHTQNGNFAISTHEEDGHVYYRCNLCGEEWEYIDPNQPGSEAELKQLMKRINDYIQSIKLYARTAPPDVIRTIISAYSVVNKNMLNMWQYAKKEGQTIERNMNVPMMGSGDYSDYNTINQFNMLQYGFGGYPQQPMYPQQQMYQQPMYPQQPMMPQQAVPQQMPQQPNTAPAFPQSVAAPAYNQMQNNPIGYVAAPQPQQMPQAQSGYTTVNTTVATPAAAPQPPQDSTTGIA